MPLRNGILVALDLTHGRELWKWKGDDEYVSYGEEEEFIYVHAGVSIVVISKETGRSEKVVRYDDYSDLKGFRSNGLIWCFDKILVVRNSGTGEVVVLDRITFEVLGREIVDRAGIGESMDRMQFAQNYLYILATSSILHIYKLKMDSA